LSVDGCAERKLYVAVPSSCIEQRDVRFLPKKLVAESDQSPLD
jgi:hypothetical protein